MKEEKKILFNSDEAAQLKTVTGWVSSDGCFYGNGPSAERAARWAGSTHLICACGAEFPKGYTICSECREQKRHETYLAKPFKAWDGKTPLYSDSCQRYFFDEEEIKDFLESDEREWHEQINGKWVRGELDLLICEPICCRQLSPDDLHHDELPEEMSFEDCCPKIFEAYKSVNKVIRESKEALSWYPGKFRTDVDDVRPDDLDEVSA